MSDCIFCKICRREAASYVLYEDEDVLSFLDIHPVSQGHALVIPKLHFDSPAEMDDHSLGKIIVVAKEIGTIQKEKLQADGFNILAACGKAAQQSVFHAHFHVVPRFTDDGMNLWFHGKQNDMVSLEEVFSRLTMV